MNYGCTPIESIRGSLLVCFAALFAVVFPSGSPVWGQTGAAPKLSRDMIPDDMPAEVRTQVERLYSDDAGECLRAVTALGDMGSQAKTAAPFLVTMLPGHFGDPHPNEAGNALLRMGRDAVDALLPALQATDGSTRRRAAYILGCIGDARAIGPLLDAFAEELQDPALLGAMRRLGNPAKEETLRRLASGSARQRRGAARAIQAFSAMNIHHRMLSNGQGGAIPAPAGWHSQPIVETLIGTLGDADRDVRGAALESLDTVGAACADARIPLADALRDALADPDSELRLKAMRVVARTESDARLDLLLAMLSDPVADVRGEALRQLGRERDPRALDAIAGAAKSGDETARAFAARALGESGQNRYVAILMGMLDDGCASVRMEAVAGLGRLRATQAEEKLLEALNDPAYAVRAAAALALGRCGGKDAAPDLIRCLDSDDALLRSEAAYGLYERCLDARQGQGRLSPFPGQGWREGKLHKYDTDRAALPPLPPPLRDAFPREEVYEALTRILEGDKTDLHALAAAVLIGFSGGHSPSDRVLAAALHSPEEIAWGLALESLSRSDGAPGRELLDPLRRVAQRDQDRRAAPLLCRMGETRAAREHSESVLTGPGGEATRGAAAASTLARDAAPRIAGPNVGAAKPGPVGPEMLAAAWRQNMSDAATPARGRLLALGAAATPAVQALLADKDQVVRAAAAVLLGELRDRSAAPALLRAMEDPCAPVRAQAAQALGALSDPRAGAALVAALGDPAPGVRDAAGAALGNLADPVSVGPLVAALGDGDWHVRRTAAESLGAIGGTQVRGALTRALTEDPHWGVRRAAAAALGEAKDATGVPALIAALGDADGMVRAAAHRTLRAVTKQDLEANAGAWRTWWEEAGKNREEPRMDTDQH